MASPSILRIFIVPTLSGRKWIARFEERVLCITVAPFVKSAQILLAEGVPPRRHDRDVAAGCWELGAPRSIGSRGQDGDQRQDTPYWPANRPPIGDSG
jgi:hypothetical protein